MKTVYLVRHAEALKKDKPIPDFERPLVKKGVKHAREVAGGLRKSGHNADVLISSPANRAIETAHIFAKGLKYPVQKIMLRELLYEVVDHQSLLPLIREQSNKYQSIMLFGHDPSLSAFARFLAPEFALTMPKAAVLAIDFDVESWAKLKPGGGVIIYYDFPMSASQRRRLLKQSREELTQQLDAAVEGVLAANHSSEAKKVRKIAKNAASMLATKFLSGPVATRSVLRRLLKSGPFEEASDTSNEPPASDQITP